MAELSPAAQAVLDAFLNGSITAPVLRVAFNADRYGLAAALRAVAEQGETFYWDDCPVQAVTVGSLLAIATELEAR